MAKRPEEAHGGKGCLTIARSLRLLAVLAAPLVSGAGAACAQDAFPSKPVHLLVPFPAGGAVDIVARTLGDELARRWGQSVVIENRPGAGGTIAAAAAAKAPPDGYTLVLVASGHAIVAHLYPKLSYDPLRDFTPLSLVGSSPNMLLVRADSRVHHDRRRAGAGARDAGTAVLWPRRQRHLAASRRRAPEIHDQDRHRGGALQGRRARPQRPARRAHSAVVQQHPGIDRAGAAPARCGRWA